MKRRLSGLAVFLVMFLCVPVSTYAAYHIHTEVTSNIAKAVEPTCTDPGLTQGSYCSECGEVIVEQQTIPALGHQFGDWVTIQEATYERPAVQTRTCSRCGFTQTRNYGSKLERIQLNKPLISNALNKNTGIYVSWKKVPKAYGYIVYRKTGSGSRKIIAQTKKLFFLDKFVQNGKTYTYYIKAIGKNQYKDSVFSGGRKMYRLNKIDLTYAKSLQPGTVTVRWRTNKKGQGYELAYGLKSNFSGATVASTTNINSVIRNLKSGRTYYIKIRVFKKVSGKRYCSCWSKAIRVKVKK